MLEKKYYQFRNRLEERYPQICEDCEPRVRQRIEQAAYTAKTDTLRRMIDRSRKVQKGTERSWLNYITVLGRCLWFGGLLLQLLWHASLLRSLVIEGAATSGIHPLADLGLAALDNVLTRLPSSEALFRLSLLSSLTGLWWNPYFVQTYRGFTKHIIGLRVWYTNQLLALFIRIVFRSLVDWGVFDPALTNTYMMGHSLTIGLTLYVSLLPPCSCFLGKQRQHVLTDCEGLPCRAAVYPYRHQSSLWSVSYADQDSTKRRASLAKRGEPDCIPNSGRYPPRTGELAVVQVASSPTARGNLLELCKPPRDRSARHFQPQPRATAGRTAS